MSEYQFYEFIAVDGPISDEGLKYAESCSSRAEVSLYRWRNVYNFGDFHGSVQKLLQYYDAHFYVANWGTIRLALAFPKGCLDPGAVQPYLRGNDKYEQTLSVEWGDKRCVVYLERNDEEGRGWSDGEGILDRLVGIREELMRGDLRALCLGWLADFDPKEWGDPRDANVHAPPITSGFSNLSPALQELVEQFAVDPDVLEAAAGMVKGKMRGRIPMDEILANMPVSEMKRFLLRVADGEGARVMSELSRLTYRPRPEDKQAIDSPKCVELASRAIEVQGARIRREAEEREAKRKHKEQLKKLHLASVLKRADTIWPGLDALMERKVASAYDEVAAKLSELRDSYLQADREADFKQQLEDFRDRYSRRSGMLRRIAKLETTG